MSMTYTQPWRKLGRQKQSVRATGIILLLSSSHAMTLRLHRDVYTTGYLAAVYILLIIAELLEHVPWIVYAGHADASMQHSRMRIIHNEYMHAIPLFISVNILLQFKGMLG